MGKVKKGKVIPIEPTHHPFSLPKKEELSIAECPGSTFPTELQWIGATFPASK